MHVRKFCPAALPAGTLSGWHSQVFKGEDWLRMGCVAMLLELSVEGKAVEYAFDR